jgi:phage gpG-like protein
MIEATINSEALNAALEGLEDALSTEAILTQAGDTLIDLIGMTFADQQDPWGNAWKPLSPWSRSGQPLRDTGRLMNSIASQISGNTLLVGTGVCYALTHQFGATVTAGKPTGNNLCNYVPKGAPRLAWNAGGAIHFAKSVTIPARPFMPIREGGGNELPYSWDSEIGTSIADMIARAVDS